MTNATTVTAGSVAADLDSPDDPSGLIVLAHGAGSDRRSVLLRTLSDALVDRGLAVARIDLPYRQLRPKGPPSPSKAALDRDGIRSAVALLREKVAVDGPVIVGGQSYGGRQASMAVADDPGLADGLLLTSYPLHPPGKPDKARTAHLPRITVPTLVVHGRSDAFGTSDEFAAVLPAFGGPTRLIEIEKADHSLKPERSGVGPTTADAVDGWLLPAARECAASRFGWS
ncbi:alpha/beta fold hydrolase [Gordonia sp. HY285]|uniref:alpha/beta hydrolase family protein n=1 Tax=Gordonia liuliyuniae TaxID=2911517 RepID=UPI001F2B32AB|nr:alpha/beta fold hydrolase [Gordonia liuliyuniae]MCF8611437.1 alpha/beta fold hydrolase [Gordonia liuliyuniae]